MDAGGLRKRDLPDGEDKLDIGAGATPKAPPPRADSYHPAGEIKHGPLTQIFRAVASVGWLLSSCMFISFTQFVGAPLYYYSKPLFYSWMSLTKQSFAIILITVTQFFSPTVLRVSWDSSLRGQFRKGPNGLLQTTFPERIVLMANHQIYTDWIYLWWMAYTSHMHGAIYIILKESLKYIPFMGWGMMFYGFIFMARKWSSDKPRLAHRLQQLKKRHISAHSAGNAPGGPSNAGDLDPMWLLIFPEGTNLSANTRKKSVAWSEKSGIPDMKHQLLPRSTGMYFCLQQLGDTLDWVYDCTVAYEGTPKGGYAQDFFTLRSTFLQGRPPKSVSLHWRRFAVKDIPLDTQESFEKWVEQRWREKDEMLETFYETGRFPIDAETEDAKSDKGHYLETVVKLNSWAELAQPYVVVVTIALLLNIVRQFWNRLRGA